MAGLVTHLRPGQSVGLEAVFAGPWDSIERVVLAVGQAIHLDNERLESAVFVEQGYVTLTLSHHTMPLSPGDAVTLAKGASGSLTASQGGTRLFMARLKTQR